MPNVTFPSARENKNYKLVRDFFSLLTKNKKEQKWNKKKTSNLHCIVMGNGIEEKSMLAANAKHRQQLLHIHSRCPSNLESLYIAFSFFWLRLPWKLYRNFLGSFSRATCIARGLATAKETEKVQSGHSSWNLRGEDIWYLISSLQNDWLWM